MAIELKTVQFEKEGNLVDADEEQGILEALNGAASDTTDVVVLSHGWNNDMNDARSLYDNFLNEFERVKPADKKIFAIGILWPSKKFADADLVAGGAAAAGEEPIPDSQITDELEAMKILFDDAVSARMIDDAKNLVPDLRNDEEKQDRFVEILGQLTASRQDPQQVSDDEGKAAISDGVTPNGPETPRVALLRKLSLPILIAGPPDAGGAAQIGDDGGAAGLGDLLMGVKVGAMRLLNLSTYYVMKDRAGKIGSSAVNPMLSRIQAATSDKIRYHLVGHSFGGRLVTAVADGVKSIRIQSILLLQAAYSHNGLAKSFGEGKVGFFHRVIDDGKVTGPILITHSINDKAVGLAYPLASRLNGDDAAGFGGADDRFGGMGTNGAQNVDKRDMELLRTNQRYDLQNGRGIFNLNGDSIIMDHSDVARAETAYVLSTVMSLPTE